ncbi:MAG TPA: hypothetical protein DCP98_08375 [Sphaerochaeta sp.]|nr:hypothetical protein [Sphaerochaeta sp.]
MRQKNLYLICANDHLETAFFCGTSDECIKILGCKNKSVFFSTLSHKKNFFGGFVRVEKVDRDGLD